MKKQVDNTFTEIPKTLLNLISNVMVDGVLYKNISEWLSNIKEGENVLIINPIKQDAHKVVVKESALHDTPFFKFNSIYNAGNPIPKTEMYGIKIEEKDKMVKMDLWDKDHKIHWVGWLLKSWILEN